MVLLDYFVNCIREHVWAHDLSSILTWILRIAFMSLVLIMVYSKYSYMRRQSPETILKPNVSRVSGALVNKSNILLTGDRPLYQIRESSCQEEFDAALNQRVHIYARDVLLASQDPSDTTPHEALSCIRYVKRQETVELPRLGDTDSSDSHFETQEKARVYLESLLQFRAFRTNCVHGASWEQWNDEARRILKGALLFGCRNIAEDVFDAITAAGILPDVETYTLMIKVCMSQDDIPQANHFVKSMRDAGLHPPDYLLQLLPRDPEPIKEPIKTLNKDAPVFVPTFKGALPASSEGDGASRTTQGIKENARLRE